MIEFKNKKWGIGGKDFTKTDEFIFCHNGLTLFLDKVKIKNLKNTVKGNDLQKANESIISMASDLNCQNTQKFKHLDTSILELEKVTFDMVTDGKYYTYKYLYDAIQANGMYINLPCTRDGHKGTIHDARTNDYVGILTFKRVPNGC